MIQVESKEGAGLSAWSATLDAASRGDAAWLGARRAAAREHFEAQGFPTRKLEEWRYTNVAPIARQAYATDDSPGTVSEGWIEGRWLDDVSARLVFIDGHFDAARSTPLDGAARVAAFGTDAAPEDADLACVAATEGAPFAALNTAAFHTLARIDVPAGAHLEAPIQVVYVTTRKDAPHAVQPRTLIRLGRGSQAQVVETHVGLEGAAYLSNGVTEIVLEDGALLDHTRLQDDSRVASHFSTTAARVARDARLTGRLLSFGALLARHDITVQYTSEGGECLLEGLYTVDGERHADVRTFIDHSLPHCTSQQNFRGVLDDAGRGVFQGRVVVREDAQKTVAGQSSRNLLLSPDATADAKPQLEIFADDVRCAHGVTIGQLDEDALFYLRSRCIGAEAARHLLTRAFAGEVTGNIAIPELKSDVEATLAVRMCAHPRQA